MDKSEESKLKPEGKLYTTSLEAEICDSIEDAVSGGESERWRKVDVWASAGSLRRWKPSQQQVYLWSLHARSAGLEEGTVDGTDYSQGQ